MSPVETCFICGCEFTFGPHEYNGKLCKGYDVMTCRQCYSGNWDGWAPHHEQTLLEHLEAEGIDEPERLENGLLPREF
ncbi:hypothetical protein Daes_0184 [Pseudodesulfovibrio aespoeensis Aspo-2]|uniref:Uncharacterized protein n=1 Tax=Pseudodesulfovibrio aespoeensis (strain ATCC 700646 / DSM 10631 / Aspo-2) TaxID=643562 RepID=E6VV60_PSEA9|nr:hypothetical protein Daes_0184 [Pseudodesulfovibrio aespoeensis Aspo-2]